MNIAILSRNKNLYSTNRLFNAGTKRGHRIDVIDYLRCYINIGENQTAIYYNGNKLGRYDAVLPRIGASQTSYGTAIVRQFEMMGDFVINKSDAIKSSRDKLRSLQVFAKHGIDMPITGYASHTMDIHDVIEKVGKTPLIMKLLQGTQGNGMVLAETMKAAESVMNAFKQVDADILIQEFIKESSGVDIRAIVVGKKVVAAMQRVAPEGEFRSNVHRGAATKHINLTPEEEEIAIKSTRVLGLSVAGVDLMRSKRGPLVLEVNSSPGLQGIELLTGADVAGEIISFIESSLK
jgi:ribosomal protein S6--L-glutamate ligase